MQVVSGNSILFHDPEHSSTDHLRQIGGSTFSPRSHTSADEPRTVDTGKYKQFMVILTQHLSYIERHYERSEGARSFVWRATEWCLHSISAGDAVYRHLRLSMANSSVRPVGPKGSSMCSLSEP